MFQAGVTSTADDDIDLLMGVKTPGADNLLGAEKKDEKKEEPLTEKKEVKLEKVETLELGSEVDHLLGGEEKKETQELDELGNPKTEVKKPGPVAKAKLPGDAEINFEAIYNDMVTQGIWDEVELPEGKAWDKDTFLEVQKLQAETKYEDLVKGTGPIGKSIIEFEKNGGPAGELLNLFKEQRDVQEYDISSGEGQEEFMRAYLEAQGNSDASIERTITSLRSQGDAVLKEEAEEKKGLWDAQYNEVIEARKKEQALQHKQMEDAIKNFEKTITTTLTTDSEATPKEKKELQNYMLNYNQNYNGRQVSQFYVDMAEVQKDPKNYVELAKFIKGLKNGDYVKKVTEKVKKEATVSSYLKIKNGAALKVGDDRNPDLRSNDKGSNFITLLNKK